MIIIDENTIIGNAFELSDGAFGSFRLIINTERTGGIVRCGLQCHVSCLSSIAFRTADTDCFTKCDLPNVTRNVAYGQENVSILIKRDPIKTTQLD